MNKVKTIAASLLGRSMVAVSAIMAFAFVTTTGLCDDISDTTTAVSGYVTAAIVVGIAVLLFCLGRKVIRKLIAVAFAAIMAGAMSAQAATDIAGVTTSVSGYVTAAIVVGIAVLLFVLGRKVLRKLI